MKTTFTLTPTNEGQELNYSETFNGPKDGAITRAKIIIDGLTNLLPFGQFACNIINDKTNKTVTVY